MSEKQKIKQKIAKLFNLGASSNVNEAEVALSQATRLMEKWGFEMGDIELADSEIIKDEIDTGRKHKHDLHKLLVPLANFCAVKVWFNQPHRAFKRSFYTVHMIGYDADVALFKHFFHYLEMVYKNEIKAYQQSDEYQNRTIHGKRLRNSFKYGFLNTLAGLLYKRAAERNKMKSKTGTELVPLKMANVEEWYEEHVGVKLRKTSTATRVTTLEGYDAGVKSANNVQLNAPVNGAGEKVKLLT